MKNLFALTMGLLGLCFNLNAEDKAVFVKPPFVTACEGKAAGADCAFTLKDGKKISDKCQNAKNPKGIEELVCGLPKSPPAK